MKETRALASAGAILAIAASTLLGGAAAQADDFYLTAGELAAAETSPYPAGWFRGNVSGTPGTLTSGTGGLTITGGQVQVLNGTPGVTTGLATVGATAEISATAGVTFQLPVFTTGTGGYTTLRADAAGIDADQWVTSTTITNGTDTFVAGSASTLAAYEAAFPSLAILAFGFNYGNAATLPTETASVYSISWNGDTYWFLPAPTITVTPTTITPAASTTTGISIAATGFIPGELVDIYASFGG